ncbi:hypothetical protein [Thermotoga neapolitana]|jgi:hypothetical protein|uniref:Uncharacterized protein n=1 Tax=Thermotoga neapolitana (strain ATCC 49049 / DSM 4359 / NBRC 107923 / NS-E) TaxID=309803 RepID=B9K8U8_THENN|nr:hypothetical protein [Thermotoga neapolitana]ACM23381.1 Putative uncharacterized protein [Thermotoga neapolitana DSM 4359]KFZ21514.1 hypothetical protein LA10_06342 [Thermotoga neapolitana LA10]MDK2785899.1 hypothetical protein [Thermotoga sp.]MDK2950041.1 hypothetical protein [Thermotoga sp.]
MSVFENVMHEGEMVFFIEGGPLGEEGTYIVVSDDPTVEERISKIIEKLNTSSVIFLAVDEYERFKSELEKKAKRVW